MKILLGLVQSHPYVFKQILNIFYYFVQSLPESMGVIALSLSIARVPLRWNIIFSSSIFISILCFGIRALPVTFGLHLPISIFLIFLGITRMTNVKPSRTIVAVFTAVFVLALLEYVISGGYCAYNHIDPKKVLEDDPLWTILGVTQAVALNIVALTVNHFLKPNEGAWKK